MDEIILLTGATGFLGTRVARRLIETTDAQIIALVRGTDYDSAMHRLKRSWWEQPFLVKEIGRRIYIEAGDLGKRNFGKEKEEIAYLSDRVTVIIHCAADLRLDGPLDEMRNVNVNGSARLLDVARRAKREHGFSRFVYVSTAYVAGLMKGHIPEDSFPDHPGFANNYEMTKYEAEQIVRNASKEFHVSIIRPGMVVGDSDTGSITTFNTVYYPLKLYLTGNLRIFPARADHRLNIVPVDYVADVIQRLISEKRESGKTYHITAPYESLPRADEFMGTARTWAAHHLKVSLPRLMYLPLPASLLRRIAGLMKSVHPRSAKFWRNIEILTPYLNDSKRFSRSNTDEVLGSYTMKWREFIPRLFSFAVYHGFMNRVPRTVHEQIYTRLSSRSRSVEYRDMRMNCVKRRTSYQMKQDIIRACVALNKFGIKKADRIVIMGPNSSRYVILDTAIGLLGAVGIPLYATTPANDIERIISDSSCRILFVGSTEILDRIQTRAFDIPIVSFADGPRDTLSRNAIYWDEFLERGRGGTVIPDNQIAFEDVATIRYSSGTTGAPKGIAFTHGQLVWMAETVSALPPWRTRIHPIRYLSFLPMNHVVEGILALYSPYYAPAPLTISFLEDFHGISKALPNVRPTVFFSVPRLYEKLWEYFQNSIGGTIYRNLYPPLRHFGIRGLIRRAVLHRAGLNRCDMLIVGSAVMDNRLLTSFRELGVEIHNAYGLTEAPLITINRYGRNRIGTVGTPLPDTDIRCDDLGQILVRGPQVSRMNSMCMNTGSKSGWLPTGDTGIVDADGYVVLTGRLRDTIVTSYGKSIQPYRVETFMRRIPGIAYALLIGDAKPYCTAIIWVEKASSTTSYFADVDRAMKELQQYVPIPEQPKRWAIISNDLSIDDGTLTPNFKIRKKSVIERNADVIDALYGISRIPKRVLSMGCIQEDK